MSCFAISERTNTVSFVKDQYIKFLKVFALNKIALALALALGLVGLTL